MRSSLLCYRVVLMGQKSDSVVYIWFGFENVFEKMEY